MFHENDGFCCVSWDGVYSRFEIENIVAARGEPWTTSREGLNFMNKSFSTCFLIQDGSNAPECVSTEVNLHPGKGISSDQGETVLIAGGFSSLTPKSSFPLSATLQLNFDLGTFTQDELERIAGAELKRKNAVDYRSYTVELDNRVCVIGDDAVQLNTWLDQYGGVLAVTPLLLKGSVPDVPTVAELNIDGDDSTCRLTYQVRSPIDFERCNYCGECGPVCPEQCISENLFLFFDECTLCKECEKICHAGAIDLHGVVNEALEVPAVIVLGDLDIDLPENIKGIFHEKDLPEYFATLFPCRIDEVVTCDNSICQYSGRLGTGCGLCLSSCNYGAISQDSKGVNVNSILCEECGECVAVCPTGALQNARFTDSSFVDYFQDISIPSDSTVVIGDEDTLQKLWWQQQGNRHENVFFLQYDTSRSLSLFHFLLLINHGARRILVLEEKKVNTLEKTVEVQKQGDLANALLTSLFDSSDVVQRGGVEDFTQLMATETATSFGVRKSDYIFINRRQSLAHFLEKLVEKSGRHPRLRPEGFVPFAELSCDTSRCTQCMACLNECHIEAMTGDSQQLTLNYTGILCVACGICARVCPENALTLSPIFTLATDFFTPVELAKAEPMTCKKCGKVFGTKKSFERVMAILSAKETVDTSHFEYCDTCRVVQLFEAE